VLSLVEDVERNIDKDKAEKLANKVLEGKGFNFEDFRDHLTQMQNMGGLANILDKLPVALPGKISMAEVKSKMDDKLVGRMIAIINSMTKKERRAPRLLNGQRRLRIAKGAGVQPAQVNQLILQFEQMEKMMKKISGGGVKGMMKNFGRKITGQGLFKR
jgi:signal recognition particle subunit SRP54